MRENSHLGRTRSCCKNSHPTENPTKQRLVVVDVILDDSKIGVFLSFPPPVPKNTAQYFTSRRISGTTQIHNGAGSTIRLCSQIGRRPRTIDFSGAGERRERHEMAFDGVSERDELVGIIEWTSTIPKYTIIVIIDHLHSLLCGGFHERCACVSVFLDVD